MMDEYIEKAALLESFKETIERATIWRDDCIALGTTAEPAVRAIVDFNEAALRVKNFPTVDAVKVVRCKDCMWHDQEHQSTVFYNSFFCKLWQIFSKPDHFCANGIRRKDG